MLDDIISKFSENKKLDKFEFSLRPNHDIDNPFTNISLNIIDNLKHSIEKTDKSTIAAVLLDEAEENINFSYKIYSQIISFPLRFCHLFPFLEHRKITLCLLPEITG